MWKSHIQSRYLLWIRPYMRKKVWKLKRTGTFTWKSRVHQPLNTSLRKWDNFFTLYTGIWRSIDGTCHCCALTFDSQAGRAPKIQIDAKPPRNYWRPIKIGWGGPTSDQKLFNVQQFNMKGEGEKNWKRHGRSRLEIFELKDTLFWDKIIL